MINQKKNQWKDWKMNFYVWWENQGEGEGFVSDLLTISHLSIIWNWYSKQWQEEVTWE